MEEPWSGKKLLFFWLAVFAVILGAIIVSQFFPIESDNLIMKIILFVVVGSATVMVIFGVLWVAIMIPFAIVHDMRQKRKVSNAKYIAYDMVEDDRITPKLFFERFEEVELLLRQWINARRDDDREVRHLLRHLYELKDKLERIPEKDDEEV